MFGDVIPSNVHYDGTRRGSDGGVFSDLQLHYGEVQETIYPQDVRSRSKQFIEYNVFVQYRDPVTKVGLGRMYENCLTVNLFGGVADKINYSLRGAKSASQNKDNRLGLGSKVVMLCINGETQYPLILGGIGDPADKTQAKFSKDDNLGLFIEFAFNGVHFFINDDGELLVQYTGATKIDGTLDTDKAQKSDVGTRLAFLKDGSWSISTDDGNGGVDQQIAIDNTNKKITIKQNTAVEIGQATDHFILGDTYRKAESSMNQDLMTGIQALSQKALIVSTQLAAAGTAMLVPVTGPVTAAPSVSAAAIQIGLMVQDLQKMAASIQKMEAQAQQYLSTKNKSD